MAEGESQGDTNPARARDHLANERTYLAWLRAGAVVMTLGLAVAKFPDHTGPYAVAAGSILVGVGAVGLVYGTSRYRRVNRQIEQGYFTTGSRGWGPSIASGVLIVAIVAAFVLLVASHPQAG